MKIKKGLSDRALARLAQATWGDLAQQGYDPKELDATLGQAVQLLTQARELLTSYVGSGGEIDFVVQELDNVTLGLSNLSSEESPLAWGESSGLVAKRKRAREKEISSKKFEGVILDILDFDIDEEEEKNYITWADSQMEQAQEKFIDENFDDKEETEDYSNEDLMYELQDLTEYWWDSYLGSDEWPTYEKYIS